MSLRDCELDIALLLQAAGVGSLSGPVPTLYPGPFPETAPDSMVACRRASAEAPEPYLANTGLHLHRETVTVLVRGTAAPGSYTASGDVARAAWSALFGLRPSEYVRLLPEDGGPTFLGYDEAQRPRWSFSVGLEYLSATAPGVVVPLSSAASLLVAGLSVTGDASVGGLLQLGAMPFASFPAPAGHRGSLLFDLDAGKLRVSDGTAWHLVGGEPPLPTAAQVPVTPVGALSSTTVQAALEELQADVSGRATAAQVQAVADALPGKADASALSSLVGTVAGKASQAALDAHAGATTAHGVQGALVGTTDAQVLSNKKHSGRLEVQDVASGADALVLPSATRLRLGAHPSAYLATPSAGDETLETPGTLKSRVLLLQQGYLAGVGTQLVLVSGNLLGPSVRLRSGLKVTEPASGRPAADGYLLLVDNANGAGGYVEAFAVRHDGTTVQPTTDTTGTPGDATAHTPRGFSVVPAGAATITLTSSCARAGCQVHAWVQQATEDGAHPQLRTSVAAGGGTFTIHCYPAPASPLRVAWRID